MLHPFAPLNQVVSLYLDHLWTEATKTGSYYKWKGLFICGHIYMANLECCSINAKPGSQRHYEIQQKRRSGLLPSCDYKKTTVANAHI